MHHSLTDAVVATCTSIHTVAVTLHFDLLTPGSMHAEDLLCMSTEFGASSSSRFLSERGQTDTQTK